MNLRTLQYLIAIADTRHFGQAAQRCFISQPTLSMQVKKLEEELGVTLIERNNKKVLLTDTGQAVVRQARAVVAAASELKYIAQANKNPYSGKLTVGIIPTVAPYLLPKIMPILSKQFPELQLYLSELQTDELVQQLQHGKLDLGILALRTNNDQLTELPLFSEAFYLALSVKHKLSKLKHVRLEDFNEEPLMLLAEGHCLRDQALDVCHMQKKQRLHDFNATSLETLKQMVAANIGITLLPKFSCETGMDQIIAIPFVAPEPCRQIGMVWRKTTQKSALFSEIATVIKEVV